jgi:hypothetical protein
MTAPVRGRPDRGDMSRLPSRGHDPVTCSRSVATGRTDLDVPYGEKDDAKRLGARWDLDTRRWYVPPGVDPAPFARWLAPAAPPLAGPTVPARVLALPELCYRCHRQTRNVVGVLVPAELTDDPDGFVPFDDVAEALAARLDGDRLADLRIGELRRRWSGVVRRAYLSNGCCHCGAIQGSFPVHEALIAHRAAGGGYEELVVMEVELPAELVERLE